MDAQSRFDEGRPISITQLLADARARAQRSNHTRTIIGIDGRSATGKTTLAKHLQNHDPNIAIIHTDNIAWRTAILDWTHLLEDGITRPYRAGHAINYRPPAWDHHNRPGAIEAPAETTTLIIEGVGICRDAHAPLLDQLIWIDTEPSTREHRTKIRIANGETTRGFNDLWLGEEDPFLTKTARGNEHTRSPTQTTTKSRNSGSSKDLHVVGRTTLFTHSPCDEQSAGRVQWRVGVPGTDRP